MSIKWDRTPEICGIIYAIKTVLRQNYAFTTGETNVGNVKVTCE